jgi:hypothetical protein
MSVSSKQSCQEMIPEFKKKVNKIKTILVDLDENNNKIEEAT